MYFYIGQGLNGKWGVMMKTKIRGQEGDLTQIYK